VNSETNFIQHKAKAGRSYSISAVQRLRKKEKSWRWSLLANDQVTRVTKGGKYKSLRLAVAAGNGDGLVGVALGNGNSFALARRDAIRRVRKAIVQFPLTAKSSIPHEIEGNFGAAKVMLRPLRTGTGIKAGKTAGIILRLGGVEDIMAKQLGSVSRINNAQAVITALSKLTHASEKLG